MPDSRKPPPGFSERKAGVEATEGPAMEPARKSRRLRLGPGGRIVIPADFREAMGIAEGDAVNAILEDGELRLIGFDTALRKAQAWLKGTVPEGVSIVDELIEDRRREAEDEERDAWRDP